MAARAKQLVALEFERLDDFITRCETALPAAWLIPELIPSQGTLLLQGTPGGGKTWLCLIIAKQAALKGRPVFFIEEESGPNAMGKRFKQLAFPKGSDVFVLHRKSFRVDVLEQLGSLVQRIVPEAEPVVILDPLVHLWVGDENKTADVSLLVQRLAVLRGFEDALIVIPTHVSKAAANGEKPSVYGARGSTVLSGWFDCILNVEFLPREPGTEAMLITPVKSRDLEMYEKRKLVLTKGTGEISIKSEKEDRADELKASIGSYVAECGPVSKNQICQAMGNRKQWVLHVIDELVELGCLVISGRGRTGSELLVVSTTGFSGSHLKVGNHLKPNHGEPVPNAGTSSVESADGTPTRLPGKHWSEND